MEISNELDKEKPEKSSPSPSPPQESSDRPKKSQNSKKLKREQNTPISHQQLRMLAIFSLIMLIHSFLTTTISTLPDQLKIAFNTPQWKCDLMSLISAISCVLGFFPTNFMISSLGIRFGLSLSLLCASVGAVICIMIHQHFNWFLLGHFVMQISLQAFHGAKGTFVNDYFSENRRGFAYSTIMMMFPLGAGLTGITLNKYFSVMDSQEQVAGKIRTLVAFKAIIGFTSSLLCITLLKDDPVLIKMHTFAQNGDEQSIKQEIEKQTKTGILSRVGFLLQDGHYLVMCFSPLSSICAVLLVNSNIKILLADFGFNSNDCEKIKVILFVSSLLGIIAYRVFFAAHGNQLQLLLISCWAICLTFTIFFGSSIISKSFEFTASTAFIYGIFSLVQLVISFEQMLRLLNRKHSSYVLVGTSFQSMTMQLLQNLLIFAVVVYLDNRNRWRKVVFGFGVISSFVLSGLLLGYMKKILLRSGLDLHSEEDVLLFSDSEGYSGGGKQSVDQNGGNRGLEGENNQGGTLIEDSVTGFELSGNSRTGPEDKEKSQGEPQSPKERP